MLKRAVIAGCAVATMAWPTDATAVEPTLRLLSQTAETRDLTGLPRWYRAMYFSFPDDAWSAAFWKVMADEIITDVLKSATPEELYRLYGEVAWTNTRTLYVSASVRKRVVYTTRKFVIAHLYSDKYLVYERLSSADDHATRVEEVRRRFGLRPWSTVSRPDPEKVEVR